MNAHPRDDLVRLRVRYRDFTHPRRGRLDERVVRCEGRSNRLRAQAPRDVAAEPDLGGDAPGLLEEIVRERDGRRRRRRRVGRERVRVRVRVRVLVRRRRAAADDPGARLPEPHRRGDALARSLRRARRLLLLALRRGDAGRRRRLPRENLQRSVVAEHEEKRALEVRGLIRGDAEDVRGGRGGRRRRRRRRRQGARGGRSRRGARVPRGARARFQGVRARGIVEGDDDDAAVVPRGRRHERRRRRRDRTGRRPRERRRRRRARVAPVREPARAKVCRVAAAAAAAFVDEIGALHGAGGEVHARGDGVPAVERREKEMVRERVRHAQPRASAHLFRQLQTRALRHRRVPSASTRVVRDGSVRKAVTVRLALVREQKQREVALQQRERRRREQPAGAWFQGHRRHGRDGRRREIENRNLRGHRDGEEARRRRDPLDVDDRAQDAVQRPLLRAHLQAIDHVPLRAEREDLTHVVSSDGEVRVVRGG